MADKRFKYVAFVTDIMTARNPCLSEPDTRGEYADGRYRTEATADYNFAKRFQREIDAVANAYFAGKRGVHTPWKKSEDGTIFFNFKSPKKKPELTDAKGNALKPGIVIRDGARIRIAGVIAAWEKGRMRGMSLWPDKVRVIKLAERLDAFAVFGPPEEGYDGSLV